MLVLPVKKSCWSCAEDLAAAAHNGIFFFSSGMSAALSVRPVVLDCIGRRLCMGCTENTLLSGFCFELVWVFSAVNAVFRCSHEAVVLSVCLPSSVD